MLNGCIVETTTVSQRVKRLVCENNPAPAGNEGGVDDACGGGVVDVHSGLDREEKLQRGWGVWWFSSSKKVNNAVVGARRWF